MMPVLQPAAGSGERAVQSLWEAKRRQLAEELERRILERVKIAAAIELEEVGIDRLIIAVRSINLHVRSIDR
jgi:hypothetical protein